MCLTSVKKHNYIYNVIQQQQIVHDYHLNNEYGHTNLLGSCDLISRPAWSTIRITRCFDGFSPWLNTVGTAPGLRRRRRRRFVGSCPINWWYTSTLKHFSSKWTEQSELYLEGFQPARPQLWIHCQMALLQYYRLFQRERKKDSSTFLTELLLQPYAEQ